MRRLARILLVGTTAATALCAAAATSAQSYGNGVNDQVQAGDVVADQTLQVGGVSENTVAVTTATANSYDATVDGGDLDVDSRQSLSGSVSATTYANVEDTSGASTLLDTAASGNVGDAGLYAGVLNADIRQQVTGPRVAAESYIDAGEATTDSVSSNTQALANSQGFGLTHGAGSMNVDQSNSASVTAKGGGDYRYVPGDATFSSAASANNVSAVAVGDSTQTVIVNQSNTAPVTEATQDTYFDNVYVATTNATASGNNLSVDNETGPLDAAAYQDNDSFVHAQADSEAYDYGAATAIAYGVGNSAVASEYGPEMRFNVDQTNDGGVESDASFTGYSGYDAASSSSAIGNASTGFACSDCQSTIDIANRQINNATIRSTSTLSLGAGGARSALGTATAVGNTASYYITHPGG